MYIYIYIISLKVGFEKALGERSGCNGLRIEGGPYPKLKQDIETASSLKSPETPKPEQSSTVFSVVEMFAIEMSGSRLGR